MATKIKAIAGLLVVNSKFTFLRSSFTVTASSADQVRIESTVGKKSMKIDLKGAEVGDKKVFANVGELLESIAELSTPSPSESE